MHPLPAVQPVCTGTGKKRQVAYPKGAFIWKKSDHGHIGDYYGIYIGKEYDFLVIGETAGYWLLVAG